MLTVYKGCNWALFTLSALPLKMTLTDYKMALTLLYSEGYNKYFALL